MPVGELPAIRGDAEELAGRLGHLFGHGHEDQLVQPLLLGQLAEALRGRQIDGHVADRRLRRHRA